MQRLPLVAVLGLALAAAPVAPAMAQDAGAADGAADGGAPDYAAAKRHYQEAETAMAAGRHAIAAREYGIAYDITKDAVLFYKLGSAFQQAGDCGSALVYYRRYLVEGDPDASHREKTTTQIAQCEAATGGSAAAPTSTGAATAPRRETRIDDAALARPPSYADQPSTWQRTAAWTSVGFALAFATAGGVLGLSARSRQDDLENLVDYRSADGAPARYEGATRTRYDDLVDEGRTLERLTYVAFGAAGVSAATAIILFVIDGAQPRPAERGVALRPVVADDGVGLAAGWSF